MTTSVTFLTSCYNAERWLHEAIESVLSQSFEDFELLVIDDGSTDGTWEVVQRYRDTDSRIVAITKPHSGLTASLNVGLDIARGRWIARLDSDDLCARDRLERQISHVAEYPDVVLVGSGVIEIDEAGRAMKEFRYPSDHRSLLGNLQRLKRFFPHSSALFRRDAARSVGGYNPRFQKSQDWDLWLRLAQTGRIACIEQALVRIRRHPNQVSHSSNGTPQWVYGTAAATCHFLRARGAIDPSAGQSRAWTEFISWLELQLRERGVIERRNAWHEASAALRARPHTLSALGVVGRVLLSPQLLIQLSETALGSWLPEQLADAWARQPCAAS